MDDLASGQSDPALVPEASIGFIKEGQHQFNVSTQRGRREEKLETEMTRAREGGGRERVMKIEKVVVQVVVEEEESRYHVTARASPRLARV